MLERRCGLRPCRKRAGVGLHLSQDEQASETTDFELVTWLARTIHEFAYRVSQAPSP